MENPIVVIKSYIISIGIKKAVSAGIKAFAGLLGSAQVINALGKFGLSVTATPDGHTFSVTVVQATLISTIIGGIFWLANYLKTKYKIKWI